MLGYYSNPRPSATTAVVGLGTETTSASDPTTRSQHDPIRENAHAARLPDPSQERKSSQYRSRLLGPYVSQLAVSHPDTLFAPFATSVQADRDAITPANQVHPRIPGTALRIIKPCDAS